MKLNSKIPQEIRSQISQEIHSLIFLDGADPIESEKAKELLGFLDGQTTNPTLLAKNPELQNGISKGGKISEKELYSFYKKVIAEIGKLTSGPISAEVYADHQTSAEEMAAQGREMADWGGNIYIKLPIIKEGLKAAKILTDEGIGVNMTLCFSQEQAAAIYSVTRGTKSPVFVSPFLGRLDDRGENGAQLIENIVRMFQEGDGHVLTLAASCRSLNHLLFCLKTNCPLITVPMKIIEEWAQNNFSVPDENFEYTPDLKPIEYKNINLNQDWESYDISHDLTKIGVDRFCADWKNLIF